MKTIELHGLFGEVDQTTADLLAAATFTLNSEGLVDLSADEHGNLTERFAEIAGVPRRQLADICSTGLSQKYFGGHVQIRFGAGVVGQYPPRHQSATYDQAFDRMFRLMSVVTREKTSK